MCGPEEGQAAAAGATAGVEESLGGALSAGRQRPEGAGLSGRYVFRIAISNSRIEQIDDGQVTFRYWENRSRELRRVTLPAVEFIARFLQHVLPRGCAKVRSYGIWSSSCRRQLEQARALLHAAPPTPAEPLAPLPPQTATLDRPPAPCPHCGIGQLIVLEVLLPLRSLSP